MMSVADYRSIDVHKSTSGAPTWRTGLPCFLHIRAAGSLRSCSPVTELSWLSYIDVASNSNGLSTTVMEKPGLCCCLDAIHSCNLFQAHAGVPWEAAVSDEDVVVHHVSQG